MNCPIAMNSLPSRRRVALLISPCFPPFRKPFFQPLDQLRGGGIQNKVLFAVDLFSNSLNHRYGTCEHRFPQGQALQNRKSEPFVGRRKHDELGGRQEFMHLRFRQVSALERDHIRAAIVLESKNRNFVLTNAPLRALVVDRIRLCSNRLPITRICWPGPAAWSNHFGNL